MNKNLQRISGRLGFIKSGNANESRYKADWAAPLKTCPVNIPTSNLNITVVIGKSYRTATSPAFFNFGDLTPLVSLSFDKERENLFLRGGAPFTPFNE